MKLPGFMSPLLSFCNSFCFGKTSVVGFNPKGSRKAFNASIKSIVGIGSVKNI
jgi:hypothetical protein